MTSPAHIVDLAAVGLGSLGIFTVPEIVPPDAQNYTVLGLLSVVVVGIGRWMVQAIKESGDKTAAAMDRNTEAQGRTATALALLVQESDESRKEGRTSRADIMAKLEHLPHAVAAELKRIA